MSASPKDLFRFLQLYIELGDGYRVDENGIVHSYSDGIVGEPIILKKADGTPAQVMIYNPNNNQPGYLICNPFTEGLGTSSVSEWFYTTRNMVLSGFLYHIMRGIIRDAIAIKTGQETCQEKEKLQELQSLMDRDLDDKQLKEIQTVFTHCGIESFFNLYYSRKQNKTIPHIYLLSEKAQEDLGKKIRKKSFELFIHLIYKIFGTENIVDEFSSVGEIPGSNKFHSFTSSYVKVLKRYQIFWGFQKKQFEFEEFFRLYNMVHELANIGKSYVSVPLQQNVSGVVPVTGTSPATVVPITSQETIVPVTQPTTTVQPVLQQPQSGCIVPITQNAYGKSGVVPITATPTSYPQPITAVPQHSLTPPWEVNNVVSNVPSRIVPVVGHTPSNSVVIPITAATVSPQDNQPINFLRR